MHIIFFKLKCLKFFMWITGFGKVPFGGLVNIHLFRNKMMGGGGIHTSLKNNLEKSYGLDFFFFFELLKNDTFFYLQKHNMVSLKIRTFPLKFFFYLFPDKYFETLYSKHQTKSVFLQLNNCFLSVLRKLICVRNDDL